MKSPILILSAPYGNGHRAAAQAIAEGIERLRPEAETTLVELGRGERFYRALLKHVPGLWEELHRETSRPAGLCLTASTAQALFQRRIRSLVSGLRPACLVCVHPFAVQAADELRQRGRLSVPVFTVITDFAVHPLWYHPGADRHFAPSPEAAASLLAFGAAAESVSVTGIPISLAFGDSDPSPESRPKRPKILIAGGGLGLGPAGLAIEHLDTLGVQADIVLVTGGNSNLFRQARQWQEDGRLWLHPLGFTRKMPQLMRSADLLITKAGGLTCSEALACGLPMIIFRPLPGHEEANARHLVDQGAAIRLDDPLRLTAEVSGLLTPGEGLERLRRMATSALWLGRPGAALEIAREILLDSGLIDPARNFKREVSDLPPNRFPRPG